MPSQNIVAATQRQSTIDSSAQDDDSRTRRTAGQDSISQRHANPAQPSSRQPTDDTRRQATFTGHPSGQAGPSASGQQQSGGSAGAESQAGVSARLPSNRLPGPPATPPASSSLPGPPPRPPTSVTPVPQTSLGPSDPALDFFSERFDALRALYTRGLQPPVPRVKALDNVVKCRLILPPELPDSWSAWNAAHPKTEPSEESARHKELAKFRTAAVMKREQDKAAKGNTLDKITERFKEGPLLLLRRYYKTSVKIQVVTRHASGPRGTAVGYLHGFDKFMNLVLMNVDETYTVMVRVPHPYTVTIHEPADPQPSQPHYAINPETGHQEQQIAMTKKQVNKFRWKRKAERRQRRLHQVFLRGDNIVTVTPVLTDVERNWPQLLPTWRAAGMANTALPTPASLTNAGSKLPPPPSTLQPSAHPHELSPVKLPLPPPFPPPVGAQAASPAMPFLPSAATSALPPLSAAPTASGAIALIAPPCPPPLLPTSTAAVAAAPRVPLLTPSTHDSGPSPAAAEIQPAWPPGWVGDKPAWMNNRR